MAKTTKPALTVRRLTAEAAASAAVSAYVRDRPYAFVADALSREPALFHPTWGASFVATDGALGPVRGLLLGARVKKNYRHGRGPAIPVAWGVCGDTRTVVTALAAALRNMLTLARGGIGRRVSYRGPANADRPDYADLVGGFVDAGFAHYGTAEAGPFVNAVDPAGTTTVPGRLVFVSEVGEADLAHMRKVFAADQAAARRDGGWHADLY